MFLFSMSGVYDPAGAAVSEGRFSPIYGHIPVGGYVNWSYSWKGGVSMS